MWMLTVHRLWSLLLCPVGRHGKGAGQGMSWFKFQRDILSAEERLGHSRAEGAAGRTFLAVLVGGW